MARPLVLVFQELAQPSAVVNVPDLNTIVLGPAYDIFDYPDDASTILLSQTYGSLEARAGNGTFTPYVPPTSGSVAATVNAGAYPGQSAGSLVDHASVKFVLRFPHVILGSTYLDSSVAPVLGSAVTTSSSDQTLITISGADLLAAGIAPGDRIILTSSYASAEQTVVRTVASVGEPNAAGLATDATKLRVTANLPAAGTTTATWTYDSSGECRIERTLATQTYVDSAGTIVLFPTPGSDTVTFGGGVKLSITITPQASVSTPNPSSSVVSRSISYSEFYLAYRALRQDLQDVGSVTNADAITVNGVPTINNIGKLDARNPLAVALSLALQNAGSVPIYYYGVASNDITGHQNARNAINTRRDLYSLVPLTSDPSILAGYKSDVVQAADPTFAQTNGVPQRFRVVLGSVDLAQDKVVYSGSITGVAQQSGASSGVYRTLSFASASTDAVNFRTVLPGDTFIVGLTPSAATWQNRRGVHKVSHVNNSKNYPTGSTAANIELVPGTNRWDDTGWSGSPSDIEFRIVGPDGVTKQESLASLTVTATSGHVTWAMKDPTVVGGPYTVTYVTGAALAVTIAGFAITVTFVGTVSTHAQVAAAANANPAIAAILTATAGGTTSEAVVASVAANISPVSGAATASVLINDNQFDRLEDTSATFLTSGVKPGDTLEFPLDPNNYSGSAYSGRLLSYKVAQVLNESRLLIQCGLDDSDVVGSELPHYFSRDISDHYIDNNPTGGSLNYRVRRALTKSDQVLYLVTQAQSYKSKRVALMFPDAVVVSDLRDGSLVRAVATVRELAGDQPGWCIAAQVGGALAGLPPQHGLTNLGMAGITTLKHSQGYFSEPQLTQISDGGVMVFMQKTPGSLPFCVHQLTTDPSAVETGELSVVKNIDYLSKFLQDTLEPFLGVYNVLPETLNAMTNAVNTAAETLKSQRVDKIGPPLLSGSVTQIKVSDISPDRVQLYFVGSVPRPLNTIELHVVV